MIGAGQAWTNPNEGVGATVSPESSVRALRLLAIKHALGQPIPQAVMVRAAADGVVSGLRSNALLRLAWLPEDQHSAAGGIFPQVISELQLIPADSTVTDVRWLLVHTACLELLAAGPTDDITGLLWVEGWVRLGRPDSLSALCDAITAWRRAHGPDAAVAALELTRQIHALLTAPWPPPLTTSDPAAGDRLDAGEPVRDQPTLIADPNGVFHGPYAHALACGANLAIQNDHPWNTPFFHCDGCGKQPLLTGWGVVDAAGWREQLESLLAGRNIGGRGEFALKIRRELSEEWHTSDIGAMAWHRGINLYAEHFQWNDAYQEQLHDVADRVLGYERSMVRDGVLMPGQIVTTALAYDYGRAVNMVHWGLKAGYCDAPTAWQSLLSIGIGARKAYTSWEQYGAAYVLGRLIIFGEDGENWYLSTLDQYQLLTTHPSSPWRNIPFESPRG